MYLSQMALCVAGECEEVVLGDALGRSALFSGIWSRTMSRNGWLHLKVGFLPVFYLILCY